jgi:hypothetical protein
LANRFNQAETINLLFLNVKLFLGPTFWHDDLIVSGLPFFFGEDYFRYEATDQVDEAFSALKGQFPLFLFSS